MTSTDAERRRRRSADPITALHYQLASSRNEAGLEAIVLVDESGCLVAGAGAWPACEELAAYAPLFAEPANINNEHLGARLFELAGEIEVERINIDGSPVLLCGRGLAKNRGAVLKHAGRGCQRILAA
jgi:hypothetical protein